MFLSSRRLMEAYGLIMFLALLLGIPAAAQTGSAAQPQLSLGERIACQSAIEEVYWRHRIPADETTPRLSFAEAVPQEVIRRKAEDAILQSLALERYWGVRITGEQLQSELDRMAAHSKSPDVLAELFAAVGNDPGKAAECLARPLLAGRLVQDYYGSDQRFHGELKARAQAELAAGSMKQSSGRTSEITWQRGTKSNPAARVLSLEPEAFDKRVRELKNAFGGPSGEIAIGRASSLREDAHRFYAVTVKALDNSSVRLASVEWPKVSFETWWPTVREQLPMQLPGTNYGYVMPQAAPNGNCRDDSWKPTMQLLDPRYWHTAVWTGTEMIVWGGMQAVGWYYNDGSRYNPATDTWTPVASLGAPGVREEHVAVWTGQEMVVFGGRIDSDGGRYNPVTDTWRPTSQVGAPLGASDSAVVWTGKEMIVWGGYNWYGATNTGGRYNPTKDKWTALPPVPLAPRGFMPAVWTGTEMVVWSGYDVHIGQLYGDGARYNPKSNTWKLMSTAGAPSARTYHTAVWTGSEMIVWGGLEISVDQSGGRYNPLTDTWTPTSLANAPSLRWMHAAVWTGSEMIVQGGFPEDPVGGRYNPATDIWTPTNATNAFNQGQGITGVWTGKEMILWGGFNTTVGAFYNDGARYNPKTDSWLHVGTMNVPRARSFHSAVWTGSEMVMWGGLAETVLSDGSHYDPAVDTWTPISDVNAPLGGGDGQGVWSGSEAIFWVGNQQGGRYDPVRDSWKLMSVVNAPLPTLGHTTVWTGTEMIVYGGVSSSPNAKRYKPSTDKWTDATMTNDPGHRDHHGAVWTGTEMIVWGGSIDNGYVGPEGGRYNPSTNKWTLIPASGLDQLRMWPVSVWTGTEAIFWAGYNQLYTTPFNDGGRYNPATNTWTRTSPLHAPSPRVAQGVWSGSEMIVWGGGGDFTGGRYNPATDTWKSTTLLNHPYEPVGGRWSTVWTGNQMIVWGGWPETQHGSLYCASGQPNVAPVAVDDAYTVKSARKTTFGNKAGVLVNDTDFNADGLTAKIVTKTAHGTLTFNANGSFIYKSVKGYLGPDSFTYQANDGVANSNVATVTITVQ